MKTYVQPLLMFISLAILGPACAGSISSGVQPVFLQVREHLIRPGDAVKIEFPHYPDLNQTLMVPQSGDVTFRGIGNFRVLDLTASELKHRLTAAYREMLAAPEIQIEVVRPNHFTVYVGGYINNPGVVRFASGLTIVRGIVLAGGLKSSDSNVDVYVFRTVGKQGLRRFKIEWRRNQLGDGKPKNLKLSPYDIVYVVKASDLRARKELAI